MYSFSEHFLIVLYACYMFLLLYIALSSETTIFSKSDGNLLFFMAALCNRAGHIYFHGVVFSFFDSPTLSSRRLDVYNTSSHGVALV